MAERLTECIDSHLLDNGEMVKEYSLNSKIKLNHFSAMDVPNAVYDKLGELEDIMEEYGMVDIQDFKDCLESMYDESINAKKLKEFKDIMAKYNIESLDTLEHIIKKGKVIIATVDNVSNIAYEELEADRDIWKRACELACEKIVDMLGDCPIETVNWQQDDNWCEENCDKHEKLLCWDRYFYQQAKKDGENK